MLKRHYFAGMVIVLAVAITCQAEFRVNTNTSGAQENADIAISPDGNFVVVWRSKHTGSRGAYGQRFSADGTPVGGEFQISTGSVGGRTYGGPTVGMDNSGNFVVAWTDYTDYEESIFARRYTSDGTPITGEFLVNANTYATSENSHIGQSVAMNAGGAFVIVWEAWHGDDGHNGKWGVYGRAYDSSGNPRSGEFRVNQLFNSQYAYVAIDDAGDFVVVWVRTSPPSVRFRRYNANGTPKGNAVQIAEGVGGYGNGIKPSLAMAQSGTFAIVWGTSAGSFSYDVYAQRFDVNGVSIGDPFMVNTYKIDMQLSPAIAMNTRGQFVTVWHSDNQDGSDLGVYGQEYNNDAIPMGREFRLNTYTLDRQWLSKTALSENGKYVTVWQSDGQDGSGYGIYGEIKEFGIEPSFADYNGDGFVNLVDYSVLAGEWLNSDIPLQTDLVDDDIIDELDLAQLAEQWLSYYYECSEADIYSDGIINLADYSPLVANWQDEGPLAGDITGNGIVDTDDLKVIISHWLKSCE